MIRPISSYTSYRSYVPYILLFLPAMAIAADKPFPQFKTHDINPEAGTGLAITVADIEGDGDLDIVGVSADDVAWYENPTWDRHLIAGTIKNSNVCIAGEDLDGDGLPEFALGADWQFNNTDSGGSLHLLHRNKDPKELWNVIDLTTEPTLHRICWADMDSDGKKELIVAPLKGRGSKPPYFHETGARLLRMTPPENPFNDPWPIDVITDSFHILHNIWPHDWNEYSRDSLLTASIEGIHEIRLQYNGSVVITKYSDGNPVPWPRSGAGEVKLGYWDKMTPFLASVEPWHATQAVVYTPALDHWIKEKKIHSWVRHVIDDTLAGGHAIWFADFDSDGHDELLVGFRDNAPPRNLPGLNIYDLEFKSTDDPPLSWTKHILDDGGMATEDALAADMNGDGLPDVVAFGRATHNIRYYENLGGR